MSDVNSIYETIKVVIADDHAIFRDGFEVLIKKQNVIELVGQASNGKELLEIVAQTQPDVVITDIQMPEMDGIEATKAIKAEYPLIEVIALSMFEDENLIIDMLEAGAKGYLLKNTDKHEVIHAVQTVKAKGMYYCNTSSNKLVRLMAKSKFNPYKPKVTPIFSEREIIIMQMMCREFCSKEIARELNISHRSVESSKERIQNKIGAKNGIGIAVFAIKNGFFSID